MVEKSFAALVAIVCLLLLARLVMPERYRWRIDSTARDVWYAFIGWVLRTWRVSRARLVGAWRWRSSRKSAAKIAEEAIQRAKRGVERDGNVYRPKSFGSSRDSRDSRDSSEPRKPH